MKTKLNIKNFRIFDKKGVSVDIKPITIVTGANSSGKSSIVKAVMLLNSFLSHKDDASDNLLDNYIDFTKYPTNLLGRFDRVVHEGSQSKDITFEFTTYSDFLSKDITTKFVFSPKVHDTFNNAYLEVLEMSTSEGIFLYVNNKDKDSSFLKFNIIEKDCLDFIDIEHCLYELDKLRCFYHDKNEHSFDDSKTRAQRLEAKQLAYIEYKSEAKVFNEALSKFDSQRINDVKEFIRSNITEDTVFIHNNRRYEVKRHRYQTFLFDIVNCSNKEQNINSVFNHISNCDIITAMTKDELAAYVKDELLCLLPQGTSKEIDVRLCSLKVLDDYLSSDFNNLYDYVTDYENKYLKKAKYGQKVTNIFKKKYSEFSLGFSLEEVNYPYVEEYSTSVVYTDDGKWEQLSLFKSHETYLEKCEKVLSDYLEHNELSLPLIYEVLFTWGYLYNCVKQHRKDLISTFLNNLFFGYEFMYKFQRRSPFQLLSLCVHYIVNEVCNSYLSYVLSYVSSSRVYINRLYPLDKIDDFTSLLKSYLKVNVEEQESSYKTTEEDDKETFTNRWIKKLGIGDAISFSVDSEGLGVQIRLEKDGKSRLLADEGYGLTQLISILIQIELCSKRDDLKLNRYFLEGLDKSDKEIFLEENAEHSYLDFLDNKKHCPQIIAIEEPEIHLHPKLQSLLADMFLEAYEKYNIHFIIETHSEYLIRKAQVHVAQAKYNNEEELDQKCPYSVIYVPEHGEKPYAMEFCTDGRFKNEFGKGFFDEATNLAFEIL